MNKKTAKYEKNVPTFVPTFLCFGSLIIHIYKSS